MKKNKLIEFASAGLPRTTFTISDGTSVKMRAFAVKELKMLMMANESGSAQDEQVLNVLDQCIETDGVTAKHLPAHDVEMLFIELYKISKGTSRVPVQFRCTNDVEVDGKMKPCKAPIKVSVDLNTAHVSGEAETKVTLTNGLVLNMRYPTVLEREYFTDTANDLFNMAMRCIVSVTTPAETLVVGEDVSEEEVAEVIEYMDEKSLEAMLTFIGTIPTVEIKFPLKCPKCGHEEIVVLRGLADFFD